MTTTATAKDMYRPLMVDKSKRADTDDTMSTHQEIADQLGISRAAVSDVEKRALRKLREILKERGLKPEDLFGEEWDK